MLQSSSIKSKIIFTTLAKRLYDRKLHAIRSITSATKTHKLRIFNFSSCIVKKSNKFSLLLMPRLSPTMTLGTIQKWFVSPKSAIQNYQLFLRVNATNLIRDDDREIIMDIEILEEGFVLELISNVGDAVEVGRPIAIICDNLNDLDHVESIQIDRSQDYYVNPPHIDQQFNIALWQAYMKE